MVDSMSAIGPKSIIPGFIASKIIDRKLNGDNFLQWRKIVVINLTGHGKKNHRYTNLPNSKTDE